MEMNCFYLRTSDRLITSGRWEVRLIPLSPGDNDERKKVNYWRAGSSLYHDSIAAVIVRDSGWYHHWIITPPPPATPFPVEGTTQSMF